MSKKKRKSNEPAQMFQDSWTYDYFFSEWKEKPLRLICRKNVSASKLFRVKRYYETLHEAKYAELIGKSRENLVMKLKKLSFRAAKYINISLSSKMKEFL